MSEWQLTVDEARRFFAAHRDDLLVTLWRPESMEGTTREHRSPLGSTCPLGVVMNVAGRVDHPGVCSEYHSFDYPDEKRKVDNDAVLYRFVRLVDTSGKSWSEITGQYALDLLDRAEREIAAGVGRDAR